MNSFPKFFLIVSIAVLFGFSCEKGDEPDADDSPQVLKEETKELEVSSGGAVLELESGVKLDIPSGALNATTTVKVENLNPFDEEFTAVDTIGGLRASAIVRCEPDGLSFEKPVQITIPILEDMVSGYPDSDGFFLLAVSSGGIDTIPCQIDTETLLATASISHFTDFSLIRKTGKWGILDEIIDRDDQNYLSIEFNATRGMPMGSYLLKIIALDRYSTVQQLVGCNIRLYRKKVIVRDEFIQGIQLYKCYAWTADDTDYSYSIKGGAYHNWPDHFEYDDLPSKKKMWQIFDANKIPKDNEKSIGIQYVRFGPDKKVSDIDFFDRSDDFDLELLGNCSFDGESSQLPVVDLSFLDPEEKYYFIIDLIGSGHIVQDNFLGWSKFESTLFTLDDLGGSFPPNSVPVIEISNPEGGGTYLRDDEELFFECYAEDKEDGELAFNSISWTSSIDGLMGNGKYLENPILSAGIHTITATAKDSEGSSSSDRIDITILGEQGEGPEADFFAEKTTVNVGDLVSFFDNSTNDPISWVWDFGDGSPLKTEKNVNHVFNNVGTYTVGLKAINDFGSDTEVKTDYIQVNAISVDKPDLIVQSISIDPVSPQVDESFEISVTVKNAGLVASGSCELALAIGGESNPPEFEVPALASGESNTIIRSASISEANDYTLAATADFYNEVDESNEENNEQSYNFNVTGISSSGTDIQFNPDLSYGSVSDIDGNKYKTIQIGEQVWMAENLRSTRYSDGTAIPHVTGTSDWDALGNDDKAYCWYDNSSENRDLYGGLYTWAAAVNGTAGSDANPSGVQGVCPSGWHLPSDAEWKGLEMYLGMSQSEADDTGYRGNIAGGKLKESGTIHWAYTDNETTNESGFTCLPAGLRYANGGFYFLHVVGNYWSSSDKYTTRAWLRAISDWNGEINRYSETRDYGFSVRCIRDD
ncbi:MAG: PKD domain-containing protein [Bacteroidetes bacterium]|nr:PKD domain-containing protein [Bacteroidota bacterium]